MADTMIFRRMEKKYVISQRQKDRLLNVIGERLTPDEYGESTICSLYIDTPDCLLARNSIEAKETNAAYKEKLRLRSYGTPGRNDKVFLELKKKYDGVVYKRRESMTLSEAMNYLVTGSKPFESQIMNEIDYAMKFYRHPAPAMTVCYERTAYYVKNMPALRITFDSSVRYRPNDTALEEGSHGKLLIPDGVYIMEIKTDGVMPPWLSGALGLCEILPASFSKYGSAYVDYYFGNRKGDKIYG